MGWVLLVAMICGHPGVAGAAEDPPAEQLLRDGIQRFDNGDFDRSRRLLEQALHITRDLELLAKIHLFIGFNSAARNDLDHARESFRAALSHDPLLRIDRRRIRPLFVRVFDAVRHLMEGQLDVAVDSPEAMILLDGNSVGKAPYRGSVVSGKHHLEIRAADGKVAFSRQVQITAGKTRKIYVTLPEHKKAALASVLAPAGRQRLWTWIAAGAAVATIGVAIGFGVSAENIHDDACSLLGDPALPCEDRTWIASGEDQVRYHELREAGSTHALVSNIAWSTAGALAITSVILYFLEGRTKQGAGSARFSFSPSLPAPGILGAGVLLTLP